MTTKNFVAIRNLEMYKCIEFHTSVPKLQGDIQCSNNLYLIKALFVVPVLNCTECPPDLQYGDTCALPIFNTGTRVPSNTGTHVLSRSSIRGHVCPPILGHVCPPDLQYGDTCALPIFNTGTPDLQYGDTCALPIFDTGTCVPSRSSIRGHVCPPDLHYGDTCMCPPDLQYGTCVPSRSSKQGYMCPPDLQNRDTCALPIFKTGTRVPS